MGVLFRCLHPRYSSSVLGRDEGNRCCEPSVDEKKSDGYLGSGFKRWEDGVQRNLN